MALVTKQQITQAGLNPVLTAVNASDTFLNDQADGRATFIRVHNGNAGACTVTIDDPNSVSPTGATAWNPDMVVSVPAGEDRIIGPIPGQRFTNVSTGLVTVTYGVTPSVTAGVFYI